MDIQEIVEKYLRENKFDGLYILGECACNIDDLFPCDGNGSILDCEPGYRSGSESSEFDFIIGPDKAKPSKDATENLLSIANMIDVKWSDLTDDDDNNYVDIRQINLLGETSYSMLLTEGMALSLEWELKKLLQS